MGLGASFLGPDAEGDGWTSGSLGSSRGQSQMVILESRGGVEAGVVEMGKCTLAYFTMDLSEQE